MDRLFCAPQAHSTGSNHAEDQMNIPEVLYIEHAELVRPGSDYSVRLRFNDRTEKTVDFKPFLENSKNPLIREYLDPKKFAAFSLKEGDLVWGDYELCFPIADLYD